MPIIIHALINKYNTFWVHCATHISQLTDIEWEYVNKFPYDDIVLVINYRSPINVWPTSLNIVSVENILRPSLEREDTCDFAKPRRP